MSRKIDLSAFAWRRDNRVLIALSYCNAILSIGLCLAALGPALLELAVQTNTSLRYTGYCFIARSAGYFLGSFAGPLYDRLPGNLLLGTAVVCAGVASLIIPHAQSVVVLGAVVSVQGAGMGACDTGANVMLIYLYGHDMGPWMQLLHASFALGAFTSPLIMRAVEGASDAHAHNGLVGAHSYDAAFYLIGVYSIVCGLSILSLRSPRGRGDVTAGDGTAAAAGVPGVGGGVGSSAAGEGQLQPPAADNQEVVISLGARASDPLPLALQPLNPDAPAAEDGGSGGIDAKGSGGMASAIGDDASRWSAGADDGTTPSSGVNASSSSSGGETDGTAGGSVVMAAVPPGFRPLVEIWIAVGITAALLFLYVGMETGFGGFVTSYGVIALGMTEGEGQLLAGAYWGAIMLGRFAAIPLSGLLKPGPYLGGSMAGCVVATIILLLGQGSVLGIWVASILFGLFMSAIFPLAISLAESCFPVNGAHATAFVVGSATGEMLLPAIISTLFGPGPGESAEAVAESSPGTVGPSIMLWTMFVAGIANMGIFVLLYQRCMWLKGALDASAAARAATAAAKIVAVAGEDGPGSTLGKGAFLVQ